MNRIDWDDFTIRPPQPQQSANSSGSFWGIVFLVIVIAAAALLFLRQPISDGAQAQVMKAQQQLEESRRRAEYQALKREVQSRIDMIIDGLNELEGAVQEIAMQFETVTEVPLDRVHETATRRIDYLILESDTFVTAWNQMKESRISQVEFNQCKKTLSDIRIRLQNGSLAAINVGQLDSLLSWIDGQSVQIQTQRDCLKRIQNELL